MRIQPAVAPACLSLMGIILSGCEGTLTLDILADAPAPQGNLTLVVDRVELLHSDGGVEGFDVEQTLSIDSGGLAATRLLSGETARDGNYTGVRLRIVEADSSYDPDSTDTIDALNLTINSNPAQANNQSYSVSEDELTEISLNVATFASLRNTSDPNRSNQDLDLSMRLSNTADTSSVSFSLADVSRFSDVCASSVSGLPRLYIFANDISLALDDIDGGVNDPLRVLHAQPSTDEASDRSWGAPRLANGSYRVALSCSEDDPALSDDIIFFCTSTQTFSGNTSVDLEASATDTSCPTTS